MDPITIALGLAKLTGLDEKIGRWIGGDNGSDIVDKVIGIAQTVTGSKDPGVALEQLKADSEKLYEFEKLLSEQEHELEKMAYKDLANARAMQMAALQDDDKFSKRFIYYFATAWSVFAFAFLGLVTFVSVPAANVRVVDTILGFLLGTVLAGMFAFFFGSSAGGERRSERQDLQRALGVEK